jgi:hypothetical protein
LSGQYFEVVFETVPVHGSPLPRQVKMLRETGRVVFRRARSAHRIELLRDNVGTIQPVWSLFLTGPNLRSWGFWCPAGRWIHWRSFTTGPRGEVVGAGCGDPTVQA